MEREESTPRIRILRGGEEQERLLEEEGCSVLIGRSSRCEIRISDPYGVVSKIHARIERNWAGTFLYDLSRNGLFVNGAKVPDCVGLVDGDRIELVPGGGSDGLPILHYFSDGKQTRCGGGSPAVPPEHLSPVERPAAFVEALARTARPACRPPGHGRPRVPRQRDTRTALATLAAIVAILAVVAGLILCFAPGVI